MPPSTDALIISVWFTAEHSLYTIRLEPVHHQVIPFRVQIIITSVNTEVSAPHPEVQSCYKSESEVAQSCLTLCRLHGL